MKIFKWHLISDLDLYLEQKYSMRIFKNRIKQLEEDNYKQYKEIDKLKKENEWLKNRQKIEIVNLENDLKESGE